MYLEISFDNGQTVQVSLSNSHTLRIIAPDNTVQDAFAFGGVSGVVLKQGEPSAPAADPAPPIVEPPVAVPLAVSPSALSFNAVQGGAVPAAQTVSVSAAPAANWTIAAPAWVGVTPANGVGSGSITLSVVTDGLAAGSYSDQVVVTDDKGATQTVSVTLSVSAPVIDPAVQTAVDAANAVVKAAQDATPDDQLAIVQAGLAEIEQDLAIWPDNQDLLTAKATLEALVPPPAV